MWMNSGRRWSWGELQRAWATSNLKCRQETTWTCSRFWTTQFMDSPVITQLFRQLFRHRTCQITRSHSTLPFRIDHGRRIQRRGITSGGGDDVGSSTRNESHWQQRTDVFPVDMSEEFGKYPMVTADQLRGRRERPKRVKMLTRDFIEGC